MALTLVQSFDHSKISAKGVCFRVAVKWAVSTLCGQGVNYFMSDEAWLQDKQQASHGKGTWKTRLEAARNQLPAELRELVLTQRPATGVETARWEGTKRKHGEYANVSEAATSMAAIQQTDRDALVDWSTRIAARHGQKVQVQAIDLASKHNRMCVAYQFGMLPANAAYVLGYLFSNERYVGGHSVAYAASRLFDPNWGVYESDASDLVLRLLEVDEHVHRRYGECEALTCYPIRLG
ncbi:hypothetical protein M8A51_13365 [Schlegelella sp. S2-27]|uniref:HEPN domain-containing protein n=1 Tax=Caldimonas mangrovi TaxID=2944811 RepID=A0ABT0YP70_9BURK|nr:hypothetical protein [Caldimonas mangrovi]MCM5680516.1 hypothetical protein [Caldimonas mangrovi]